MEMESQVVGRERGAARRELRTRLTETLAGCTRPVGIAVCAFLFSLVRWLGIPSPFAAAFILAQNARDCRSVFPLLGLAASFGLRLLWGAPLEPWLYVGCVLAWGCVGLQPPRKRNAYLPFAALAMLPQAIATALTGTALDILLAVAAVPICMGATLWLRHGLDALENGMRLTDVEDKLCALLPPLLIVAGLGYLRFGTVHLGYAAAVLATLLSAYALGGRFGCMAGGALSLALMLSGHDARLAIPLALGGTLAGLFASRRRRWLSALAFGMGLVLAQYLTRADAAVLSLGEAALGTGLFLILPSAAAERLRAVGEASALPARPTDHAFVQGQLERWESAIRAMAATLPAVNEDELAASGAAELSALLCGGCSERMQCHGRDPEQAERFFQAVWLAAQKGDEALDEHIASIRGSGCVRLHALAATVEQTLSARRARLALRVKARFQREMTVTNLDAMVAVIGDIRRLTSGETLGDLQASFQISKALHELNYPAELTYARRVDGHLLAELRQDGLLARSPERLLKLLEKEAGMSLQAKSAGRNRLELEELPLYSVELGVASVCAGKPEAGAVSGDAVSTRQLRGGRYLLALSDGMGHGERASKQSQRTIELLFLALQAGYTHKQAITVVNGMMLTAADEERFATVDLFDLDLWTGDVRAEKLGACASYIVRGNYIKKLEGSSLPLGILESVAPTSQGFRLHSGDILVLVSDGTAEALAGAHIMEKAIADSLYIHPQRMADALLRQALLATDGAPRDDMTVAALLLVDRKRSAAQED